MSYPVKVGNGLMEPAPLPAPRREMLHPDTRTKKLPKNSIQHEHQTGAVLARIAIIEVAHLPNTFRYNRAAMSETLT